MIWPHDRRRPTRSGAVGRHVAFQAAKSTSARRAPSASSVVAGLLMSWISPTEPFEIAPQKKSVASVPRIPPVGTAKARSRQVSDHVIGSVHCVFRFGPVGPLKNARWSSPHRPSKPIQGNASSASPTSLGIVRTSGESSRVGPRVSSQPTPSSPELPMKSASS
jgi:hypothetical protein